MNKIFFNIHKLFRNIQIALKKNLFIAVIQSGFPRVREMSRKSFIFQGQGNVREFENFQENLKICQMSGKCQGILNEQSNLVECEDELYMQCMNKYVYDSNFL